MVWGNLRGLNFRQRRHFYGMLLDYLHGIAVMIYLPCLLMSLLGWTPFVASGWSYLLHITPVVLATELLLLATNRPYNDRRGQSCDDRTVMEQSVASTGIPHAPPRDRSSAILTR